MKELWRKLGIFEGQKWKNFKANVGDLRDLRISEISEGVRLTLKVSRYSAISWKESEGEDLEDDVWLMILASLQMRSRRGSG